MAMPAIRTEWTVAMLDELPDDGNRYELIDGELFVTPAPSDVHQLIVMELSARLHAYVQRSAVARVIASPSDVRRPDREKNRVQPDLFVIKLVDRRRPPYPFDLSDLLLAVEVVSPSNSQYDHQTKRELYLRNGVAEYWIVDPGNRTVHVYALQDGVYQVRDLYTEQDSVRSNVFKDFQISLGKLFNLET